MKTRWVAVICCLAAFAWALAGRIAGPSDAWDQAQPRTISYTVDILRYGGRHWILPIERGEHPATKPPIYNWLAVPAVRLLGCSSDLGHKAPSVVAACFLWLALVRLGRWLDPEPGGTLGWLTGAMLVSNYFFIKLAYLARPDMLLTLWLVGGWMAATALLVEPSQGWHRRARWWLAAAFWACTALALLTKGPPAIVLPMYALVAARGIRGSWRSARVFAFGWGLPVAAAPFALWVAGVWAIDRCHLIETLWFQEFFGRVTGIGDQAHGPTHLLLGLFDMPVYFLVRFLPWSVLVIPALMRLWSREGPRAGNDRPVRNWQATGDVTGPWLHGAGLFIVLVVALFSISAGKHADYIAASFPPGALVAAWWWLRSRPGRRFPWMVPAAVAANLAVLTISQHARPAWGDDMNRFIREAEVAIAADPQPIVFWVEGTSQLVSYLGEAGPPNHDRVIPMLEAGRPFWIVAGRRHRPPHTVVEWLEARIGTAPLSEVARSATLDRASGWPEQVVLYRVEAGTVIGPGARAMLPP